MIIVAISGQTNSGKDTVADKLVEDYGFIKVALADPMKRYASQVFEFTDKELWGPSKFRNKSFPQNMETAINTLKLTGAGNFALISQLFTEAPQLRKKAYEKLEDWVMEMIALPDLSARILLQSLGTEWGRTFYEDVWIDHVVHIATKLTEGNYYYTKEEGCSLHEGAVVPIGVVVSDIRFTNELAAIKKANGFLIRVKRPSTDGAAASTGLEGHASESEQKTFNDDSFNYVIHNTQELVHLLSETDKIGKLLTGGILPVGL